MKALTLSVLLAGGLALASLLGPSPAASEAMPPSPPDARADRTEVPTGPLAAVEPAPADPVVPRSDGPIGPDSAPVAATVLTPRTDGRDRAVLTDAAAAPDDRRAAIERLGNASRLVEADLGSLAELQRSAIDPSVRATALWGAGRIGSDAAIDLLAEALGGSDPLDRQAAALALQEVSGDAVVGLALAALERLSDLETAILLIDLLAVRALEDPDVSLRLWDHYATAARAEVRQAVLRTLGRRRSGVEAGLLLQVARRSAETVPVRRVAIESLGQTATDRWPVDDALGRLGASGDPDLAPAALRAIDARAGVHPTGACCAASR